MLFVNIASDPDRQVLRRLTQAAVGRIAQRAWMVIRSDETDIRLFPVLRRLWMRIGQQVKLVAPLKNQCRTIFGSIEIHTGEVFSRCYDRKRTSEMVSYLDDMLVQYAGRPVLLILDHASIPKSRALQAWLLEHRQIEMLYVPKYAAPRDNPIEKLWWHLKGYAAANRCCHSMSEVLEVVDRSFSQLTPDNVFQLVG